MATDEQLWWASIYLSCNTRIIPTGITTNMLHQHFRFLALPAQHLWIHHTQVTTIDISAYCTQGAQGVQAFSNLQTADVTCMPDLIALTKIACILLIPKAMSVTYYPYAFHIPFYTDGKYKKKIHKITIFAFNEDLLTL